MKKNYYVDNFNRNLNIGIGFLLLAIGFLMVLIYQITGPHYALAYQSPALQIVNAIREEHHVNSLVEIQVLDKSAYLKAEDEYTHHYFAHKNSLGQPFYQYFIDAGFAYVGTKVGEDLGNNYSDNLQLVEAFLNSSEHRRILLSPHYQYFGFSRIGQYTVMHFGGK